MAHEPGAPGRLAPDAWDRYLWLWHLAFALVLAVVLVLVAVDAAVHGGGNRAVTLRVFPDLDHLMVHDPDGNPAGYAALPSPKVSREVLGTLADWLAAKLR